VDLSSFNVLWNVNGNNARTSEIVDFAEQRTCSIVREPGEGTVTTELIEAKRRERKYRRTSGGDELVISAYECSASIGFVRRNA
jgi:hypothetical protein